MNKALNQKITQTENLITQTKASLKSWASQIGHYHKTLKELTSQLNSLKSQITMNQSNQTKPTKSTK